MYVTSDSDKHCLKEMNKHLMLNKFDHKQFNTFYESKQGKSLCKGIFKSLNNSTEFLDKDDSQIDTVKLMVQ